MVREIKFRAWDKNDRRFLSEDDNVPNFLNLVPCQSTGQFIPMYMEIEELNIYDTDIILMQYTGLKDRSGTEIYEGDIVEDDSSRYQVMYHADGFYLHSTYDPDDMLLQLRHAYTLSEVIGNIYENPELLEKREE